MIRPTAVAVLLVALVGMGPSGWWLCDLLANLRLHSLAATVVALPLLLAARDARLLTATALTALLLGGSILAKLDGQQPSGRRPATALRIVSYNLRYPADDTATVRDSLGQLRADIVVLQEYSAAWHDALSPLAATHPFIVAEPREDYFGVALYSALPLENVSVRRLRDGDIPFIVAEIELDDRPVSVIGIHLEWPVLPSTFAQRNRQLDELLDFVAEAQQPVVVCGDWNVTPWSAYFRRILAAGLDDGAPRARLRATWPAGLGPLGIPIDHCFASPALEIYDRRALSAIGSDHLPIATKVGFRRRQ